MKVSVIIPVYNEVNTIEEILHRVEAQNLANEILVIDDGSTDGTREKLASLNGDKHLRIILHDHNQGKGAAVRTGIQEAIGDAQGPFRMHPAGPPVECRRAAQTARGARWRR